MQVIAPSLSVELNVWSTCSGLAARRPARRKRSSGPATTSRASHSTSSPGPVFRPTIISFAPDDHVFMLVMHHVATDGYSRGVLYRDLTTLYEALAAGGAARSPVLPIQYADYAVWHRNWLDSGVADEQLEYWKREARRAPRRGSTCRRTSRGRRCARGSATTCSVMLDAGDPRGSAARSRAMRRDAVRRARCAFSVLALAATPARTTSSSGHRSPAATGPSSRRWSATSSTRSRFASTSPAIRPSRVVGRARDTTLEAFANADVPYETVVRATNPRARPQPDAGVPGDDRAPQPGVADGSGPSSSREGIRATEITHEKGWSKFDLLLGMSERTNGLNTTWEYSTELFSRRRSQRMMEHFRALAESAAAVPDGALAARRCCRRPSARRCSSRWNARAEPLPERESIKELFEEQVARTPDATGRRRSAATSSPSTS